MEIIQVPPTDRQTPVNHIRTRTFFIVNDQLDEDVLKNALDRLIRDHWRKLGARLVTRPSDGIPEYHLPHKFDEKYALFGWSSRKYDHSIDEVESFPKPTQPEKGATLLPSLETVEHWLRPSDWPMHRKGESKDTPTLYVHISHFDDATSIGLNYPHVLADQFGAANILRAWLGMIKGEVPPPMIGANEDILANGKSYSDYPAEEIVRKGRAKVRSWGEYSLVILGFLPELIRDRKEDQYHLFLPFPLVESLRKRHSETLAAKYGVDPAISHGDIISAILLKLVRMRFKSPKMMSLSQSVNLRGRVERLQRDRDRNAYVHNCLQFATSRFQFDQSTPVSEIAYENRKAILQAIDPKDIEISLAAIREMVRHGQSSHICEPFERSYFVTNWCAAWKGLDFSPARKEKEKVGDVRTDLKLTVLGESQVFGGPQRFSSTILCKTAEGYWCNLGVGHSTSRLIDEYLKKDPLLENF